MANRADIRTRVRDYLYEVSAVPSAVKLWTDDQLDRLISEELLSLPKRGVYLQEIWEIDFEPGRLDYTLPDRTEKVELVEMNTGSTGNPYWQEVKGWKQYAGALIFKADFSYAYPMRISIKKAFANLTDNSTAVEVADADLEVLVLGAARRATRMLLSYFMNAKNWDTVAKPDGVSLNQILNMYQAIKTDYKEALQSYVRPTRARDIDLIG